MPTTIEWIPSPNYRRRRKPITALVIHYTGSLSLEGTVSWFKRGGPTTQGGSGVSAHYVVGRDGRLVHMVKHEHEAWHAGRSMLFPPELYPRHVGDREKDVNQFSLGIELVGTMDSGFTDRQLATLYELLAQLVSQYHIPPERVVGHLHVAPGRKIDPDGVDRQFPWAKTRQVCQAAYHPVPPMVQPSDPLHAAHRAPDPEHPA